MNEPSSAAQPTRHDKERAKSRAKDRLEAIGLMLVALVFFSCLDTAAKYLATRKGLPVTEIAWMRFLVQFVLILTLAPAFGVIGAKALFKTERPAGQLVRSAMMAATTGFNFLALKYLRLDQTITIVFLTPLVVALLAGPMLGEWVGWRRMAAILVGFVGIVVAVRPGLAEIHPAVLYSLGSMLAYAYFMILTRQIAGFDPPLVTLFYSMFVGTALGAPFAYAHWVTPPDALAWVLLLSLGVLGGTGHYLFILAYRRAPASTIAPFLYLQLLTMVALGWLVFGDVPDFWTMAGAGIVVASGIYLVHRERVVAKDARG